MNEILSLFDNAYMEAKKKERPWLLYLFPEDKSKLSRLSLDHKMEWYAHQFEIDQRAAAINLSTPEFMAYWKWKVVIPMRVKRFFYRVKNREVFKHYAHISDMKAARKAQGPERI